MNNNSFKILIILILHLSSVSWSQKTNESTILLPKVELNFYPTGSPEKLRYCISIRGDSIFAQNLVPSHRIKKGQQIYFAGLLSKKQSKKLINLIKNADKSVPYIPREVSDVWGATLRLNDKVIYQTDYFSLKALPKMNKILIDYIIKLAKIKIDLYAFV